jgi:lipopolysaccharide heptosyltransferase II
MNELWSKARRILCVRLDSLGDVLMTGPALRAVKSKGKHVTLLTSPSGAAAARLMRCVDEVIEFQAPWMKASGGANSEELASMAAAIRAARYEAAIIFTVYTQSALPAAMLCYSAGVSLRLAYCRENPYSLLTDWEREVEPGRQIRHEVSRQLNLVHSRGFQTKGDGIKIDIPAAAVASVAAKLEAAGLSPDQKWWVVLHPGATAASRRYPPASYARAASLLYKMAGTPVVFTGSEEERPLVEEIRSRVCGETLSLAGRLSTAELAALIARAPLLISNNTGPVHLAAATGTPVVVLYALTNPQHTPWKVPSRVLFHDVSCRYCYKSVCPMAHGECLALVDPSEVVSAAVDLLSNPRDARPPLVPLLTEPSLI